MNFKVFFTGALFITACNFGAETKPLTTQEEKASYGVGMNVGSRFKNDLITLDIDAFVRGFRDAISGAKPALSDKEISEAVSSLTREVEKKMAEQGEKNKKAGEAFLLENKEKNEEVKSAPSGSGLQYQVLREGTGPTPKEADVVKVHYKGTLIDGTVFDSSYDRDEPATFPVGQVIRGWVEALQMMKVGAKWKLFIPSDLAYGPNPQGKIPPNSTLIFEVELLGIEK